MHKPNPILRRLLNLLPTLFVLGLVSWTYFTFVGLYAAPRIMEHPAAYAFQLIVYHIALLLFLTSLLRTTFGNPGRVPVNIEEQLRSGSLEVKTNGEKRYCNKCLKAKPDRCHHCSVCDKCTLKMDHHCPWVGNCVGWGNYKFFVLFLTYTVVLCAVVTLCLIPFVIEHLTSDVANTSGDIQILVTFLCAAVFGFGLFFFAAQHYRLAVSNTTTIESFEKFRVRTPTGEPSSNPYDLGRGANFQQVFGPSKILAFLPVANQLGNGIVFPTLNVRTSGSETPTEQGRLLEV